MRKARLFIKECNWLNTINICSILPLLFIIFFVSCAPGYKFEQSIIPPEFPDKEFNITDFGAVPDSGNLNKIAIDKTIEACYSSGGGKVIIPADTFWVAGPIHLKSNINLHLKKGAILKFGGSYSDYLPVVTTSWEATKIYNYSPFIYAYQQENIAITGQGTIDGESAETWGLWRAKQRKDQLLTREMNHNNVPIEERIFGEGHYLRPQLIQFYECEDILLDSIRIEDAPFWCVHLLFSNNITACNMSFDAHNPNNDGFDPESSQNVLIENIQFNNSDDNIAIKSGRDHEGRKNSTPSKNIIVRNCQFQGLHAITIGSEMSGGVENIFVENCTSSGYVKRGIYLKSNKDRGGYMKNINISNVEFLEVLDLFYATSNYKNEGEGYPSKISNINISDITCNKVNNYAILIEGPEELKISNINLFNWNVNNATQDTSIVNATGLSFKNIEINNKKIKL